MERIVFTDVTDSPRVEEERRIIRRDMLYGSRADGQTARRENSMYTWTYKRNVIINVTVNHVAILRRAVRSSSYESLRAILNRPDI